ncbi:MAG: hypothetical protein JHC93_03145, partial [Parachlamydiales bacterium]|nr:hypothetical protein [Parachlamydiales bacterium]
YSVAPSLSQYIKIENYKLPISESNAERLNNKKAGDVIINTIEHINHAQTSKLNKISYRIGQFAIKLIEVISFGKLAQTDYTKCVNALANLTYEEKNVDDSAVQRLKKKVEIKLKDNSKDTSIDKKLILAQQQQELTKIYNYRKEFKQEVEANFESIYTGITSNNAVDISVIGNVSYSLPLPLKV